MSEQARTFIQWKGTDVCMDVVCSCGADHHVDDITFGHWTCPDCKRDWRMPGPTFGLELFAESEPDLGNF